MQVKVANIEGGTVTLFVGIPEGKATPAMNAAVTFFHQKFLSKMDEKTDVGEGLRVYNFLTRLRVDIKQQIVQKLNLKAFYKTVKPEAQQKKFREMIIDYKCQLAFLTDTKKEIADKYEKLMSHFL